MFGFRVFICILLVCLSVVSPQEFSGETSPIESQTELAISSKNGNQSALIVDNHLEVNRVNWSLKTFKIASHYLNNFSKNYNAENYKYKLLYIEIGKTIPLKLTPTAIIFPFHSFT